MSGPAVIEVHHSLDEVTWFVVYGYSLRCNVVCQFPGKNKAVLRLTRGVVDVESTTPVLAFRHLNFNVFALHPLREVVKPIAHPSFTAPLLVVIAIHLGGVKIKINQKIQAQ